MEQAGDKEMKDERKELREILNRWDPIGVYQMTGVEWPEDEYDSYVEPLLCQLRLGKSVEQLTQYLGALVTNLIGTEAAPRKTEQCAKEAFEWFHRRRIH